MFVARQRIGFIANDYKSKDSGDWGINVQYKIEAWDLETAFIYMNNTDRLTSGLYGTNGADLTTGDRNLAAQTNASLLGSYGWVYKDDIDTFGIALSKEMFEISWGADFVYRKNNALSPDLTASLLPAQPYAGPGDVNPGDKYPGPTGDTAHIVLNGLGLLDGHLGLWDGGQYLVEVALSESVETLASSRRRPIPLLRKITCVPTSAAYLNRPGIRCDRVGISASP